MLILSAVAFKLLLAALFELGNDEVYYTGYARQLQLNYFDHPPFVAFILKAFSLNLQLRSEVFLRMGFIITGAVSSCIFYQITDRLYGAKAALIALVLFSASPYAGIISGFMIMPDAPLLLFWLASTWQAIKIVNRQKVAQSLLLFGLFSGFAILSKVSAIMLWLGFAVYLILMDRQILKNRYLYIALLISLILASPIIWWDPVSTAAGASYHAARVTIGHAISINWSSLIRQLLGEVMYNNPLVYILTLTGALSLLRKNILEKKYTGLLICLSLPLIIAVDALSAFRDTLPHWTGPSFVILFIFAAIYLAWRMQIQGTDVFPKIIYWCGGLLVAGIIAVAVLNQTTPLGSVQKDKLRQGKGDILLDMSGWKQFSEDFFNLYNNDRDKGIMKPGSYIICDKWFPGAHIDWYVAQPNQIPFLVWGSRNNLHQYIQLNQSMPQISKGEDAYYISVSNYFTPPGEALRGLFQNADPAILIPQRKAGVIARYFIITRLHHFKSGVSPSGIIEETD